MPTNNETIIETVDATANEVAKAPTDKTGFIFVGLGLLIGIGATVGAVEGRKFIKKKVKDHKDKKAAKKEAKTEESAE